VVPDQKILRFKLLAVESGTAALLFSILAAWLASPEPRWVRTPLDIPVALYAAGGLLFYAISPERGASNLELTRILFSAAVFFAASQTVPRLGTPQWISAFWGFTAGLLGIYALLQTRGGLGPLMVPKLERPIATFGNPIFLGAFLTASVALLTATLPRAGGKMKPFLAAFLLLAAAGLWTTQTRASVAGLAFAGAAAALLLTRGRLRWVLLGGLAAAAVIALWWFRHREWTHGLIWRDTLSMWMTRPLLGCGLGRFHIEFSEHASEALRSLWPQRKVIINFAHNEYLQVLAETGVLGFGLLAGVLACAAAWAVRERDRLLEGGAHRLGLALAAAALLAQNFFSPDIRFGVSSFIVFYCLGAASGSAAPGEMPRSALLPAFPGRFGFAALGAVFLSAWGWLAVQPILAQRRLVKQPKFHIQPSDRLSQVLRRLEDRLKEEPRSADLAENLAFAYAKQKSWPQAISRFELAAKLDPKRPGPLNNMGNIYYSLGDLEKAITYWKRSLAVDPGQLDAHLNLGKSLYEVGRLKESAGHLEAVLEKQPANEKAQILLKKMIE